MLYAVITGAWFGVDSLPGVAKARDIIVEKFVLAYPENLEVTVEEGVISSNTETPLILTLDDVSERFGNLDMEDNLAGGDKHEDTISNFLVLDTKTPLSLDAWNKADTVILIGSDGVAHEDRNAMKILPVKDLPTLHITKDWVKDKYDKFEAIVSFLPFLILLLFIAGSFSGIIIHLLWAFILALLVLLIGRINKLSLTYGGAYKITVYAMTAGVTYKLLVSLFSFPHISFVFSIVTLLVVFLNLRQEPSDTESASV